MQKFKFLSAKKDYDTAFLIVVNFSQKNNNKSHFITSKEGRNQPNVK